MPDKDSKFHLEQKVMIWDRNVGEVVRIIRSQTGDTYEVEWKGFHGTLSAIFNENELSEKK